MLSLLHPPIEDALTGALDPTIIVGLVLVVVLAAVLVVLYQINARMQRPQTDLEPLQHLAPIETAVRRLAEEGDGLDLRRLEHVLIDIRDGQRRLEERMLALLESSQNERVVLPTGPPDSGGQGRLSERVTSRLLAMGFERIEILTPFEELERLTDGDGEVVVEARRSGSSHKGRVVLRDGAIADVRMRDGYEAFP